MKLNTHQCNGKIINHWNILPIQTLFNSLSRFSCSNYSNGIQIQIHSNHSFSFDKSDEFFGQLIDFSVLNLGSYIIIYEYEILSDARKKLITIIKCCGGPVKIKCFVSTNEWSDPRVRRNNKETSIKRWANFPSAWCVFHLFLWISRYQHRRRCRCLCHYLSELERYARNGFYAYAYAFD